MPEDNITPGEQDNSRQQVPDGYIEKARYDGLVRKVEELTLSNRKFVTDLEAKNSEIEQLRVDLGIKDTEKNVSVTERDKKLEEYVKRETELTKEIEALRAYKLKVDTVREMKDPRLLSIIDKIPAMSDPEALKSVLSDFSEFANSAAKERETQLLSGVTPPMGGGDHAPVKPASNQEWEKHVNSLPLGSAERQKAMDEWFDWGMQNHK